MGLIDISGFGKLSLASKKDATLLIVYGGIDVDKTEFDGVKRKKPVYVPSGYYMWPFMKDIQDRFHIFVAATSPLDGEKSYNALVKKLKENEINDIPASRQILYLFSGGGAAGTTLLDGKGADRFSLVFLVDIWMGFGKKHPSPFMPDFYKHYVNTHADK